MTDTAARKIMNDYVEAMTSLCIVGKFGEYFLRNPEMIFERRSALRGLFKFWNIANTQELKQNVEWTIAIGARKEFGELYNWLSSVSEAERASIGQTTADPARKHQLSVVRQYVWRMPTAGIAAYDYSMAVFRACAGQKLGYITEQEKWAYIEEVIPLVKDDFSNWKDYLYSFNVGAVFTSRLLNADYISENGVLLTKLLFSRNDSFRRASLG
ncbi:DUF1266 domain-containing protein [Paenibacillus ehimensis]|uniref:DUF1266 domain-containing protein n=1 Tax=Paenibacillus ehimensis TaxID=79264 RepID=A0ABT8V7B0_9BACL|nr:DUF1266 domain-containing protein [Paenibacillus ehimensis]MDO3676369.1 DUF1266 domain-containing protein [Paenibacillus ehimensis]MEC0212251.1 DUF1266 domain-containing protein [Paenibacillus ehimensis]